MPNTHDPIVAAAIKRHGKIARLQQTVDAVANLNTGIGTSRDKTRGAFYLDPPPLDPGTLEALFANNDLAYTIVTKPVDDALRAWFCVERCEQVDEDDEADARAIQLELERLGARKKLKDAVTWGRLFGGGGVVLVVEGAGPPQSALDDTKITKIVDILPFDRQDMMPLTYFESGDVQTYMWQPTPVGNVARMPMVVHASRVLLFGGARTTVRRKKQNQGWDLSVLQRVYEVLSSFDSMWGSVDNMFADASQAVFKMQGLIQSLAESDGDGRDDVQTRLAFMDLVRSTAKAIMLDAGNKTAGEDPESFEVVERTTLGTLDGVIQMYMVRLATAARMPLTVLLGMAPAGMDATGESDLILYYNNVDIFRMDDLEPNFLRLVKIIARTLGDSEVDDWRIKWPELARPKPVDVATAEKMNMDALVAAVAAQILLPEEAALNIARVAPTMGVRIDTESRRKALKDGLAEVEAREVGMAQEEAQAKLETTKAVEVAKAKPAPAPAARDKPKAGARSTKSKAAKRQV